jgi:hypothetical protein
MCFHQLFLSAADYIHTTGVLPDQAVIQPCMMLYDDVRGSIKRDGFEKGMYRSVREIPEKAELARRRNANVQNNWTRRAGFSLAGSSAALLC